MVIEKQKDSASVWIDSVDFGTTKSGERVTKFRFGNANGFKVEMLNYGATVSSIKMPDRLGNVANIALGCEDIASYESNEAYLGATVGPFCNRICGATFTIDGQQHRLTANDGANTLHGGKFGFHQKVWAAEPIQTDSPSPLVGVRFSTTSPDGEDGFPGTAEVSVVYLLNSDNQLSIEFSATTDKASHINLTNHCYWNLSGIPQSTVHSHLVQIKADEILDVDAAGIPSGEMKPVAGTIFDFNDPKRVGDDIQRLDNTPQGYDHSYILNASEDSDLLRAVASVSDSATGRCLEIFTDQPALQFYTSNHMDGKSSSGGHPQHAGIALETQGFPDAPNHSHFPSTLLVPGQEFRSKTVLKFSLQK